MKTAVFQFNGCEKCFNETVLLGTADRIAEPDKWKPEKIDVAILTGYLTPENKDIIDEISNNSKNVIAYGSCTVTGGVFGLAYQKGHAIIPLRRFTSNPLEVHGCLGEIEELQEIMKDEEFKPKGKLCDVCNRKSTCDYLDEVYRNIDISKDEESCFNDLGYLCNGYVATTCKELCVNSGAPCRGCKPLVDRPGFRMLGMFGTLMGNIEVATEATGKGGTDKLADEDDDVTDSFPDLVGDFFRFNLADTVLPKGKNASKGSILADVFIGRPIEELPLILGLIGGSKAISLTISAMKAYENAAGLEINDETNELRKKLLDLESKMNEAIKKQDIDSYKQIRSDIIKVTGNMNLSNLFFGGFRTPIEGIDYEKSKYHVFDLEEDTFEGTYNEGQIKYTLDSVGIITEFEMEV